MKNNKVLSKILTVVIAIECFILVISTWMFVEELKYEYAWYQDERHFIYCLEDERYGDLVRDCYYSELQNSKATMGMKECYGVAKYFEAALWKNVFDTVGNAEKSAVYEEKMNQAYLEMGDYSFLDAKIRQKLNME